MHNIRLSIQDPCHENWGEMKEQKKGRHCEVCQKTVVDFTEKSRSEIEAFFTDVQHKGICGRFRASDIQTAVAEPVPPMKVSWFRSRWLAIAAAVSFFGISKKAPASAPVDPLPHKPGSRQMNHKNSRTIIHGAVRNTERNGIARVDIRVFSGGREIAFSKSFANGSYLIDIPANEIWDFKIDIEYNAVDYHFTVLKDIPVLKDRHKLDIMMAAVSPPTQQNLVTESMIDIVMGDVAVEPPPLITMGLPAVIEMPEPLQITGAVSVEGIYKDSLKGEDKILPGQQNQATPTFGIKTYPNPSSGIFNLASEKRTTARGFDVGVYDLKGNLILSKKVFAFPETMDIGGYPNGTYLVTVTDIETGQRAQSRVVKTH